MSEFFIRLQQRKLVQWAIAYVAFAFALLQGIDIVAQRFAWPESVERILILALCVGFFVALVLAWYHGERGAQRVSSTELVILALLLAIGGGLLWRFAPVASPATGAAPMATATKAAATAIPAKSIAVLPFENLSADKDNAYFASGMQDMILTKLSEVHELRVASRTSTEKYAEHRGSVRDIAAELRVAYVLEGSVQKAGNQVLINLQLIDARDDAHLWAQAYRRTLDDIFGVEGEVAKLVAHALHAELTVAEAARVASVTTHNAEAYDRFLRSRFFLNQSNRSLDPADLDHSIELAKQAVAIDPGYVDAWSLLSLAYIKRGGPGAAADAEASARKALALDPDSAGGHLNLGFSLMARGRNDEAVAEARTAVRLRPDQMRNQVGLGITLAYAGRFEEAKTPLDAAATLDPESNFVRNTQANMYVDLREYAKGRDLAQASLTQDPADLFALSVLQDAQLLGFGDIAGARRSLKASPVLPTESATFASMAARVEFWTRDFDAARRLLEQAPQGASLLDDDSRELSVAEISLAQGNAKAARSAYAQARDKLQSRIRENPDDARLQSAIALCLSGLGDHADALRIAEKAVTMPHADVFGSQQGRLMLALVQMRAGRTNESVQTLRSLMQEPAGIVLSVQSLRLDPTWDSIRNDPGFQALLDYDTVRVPASRKRGSDDG